MWVLLSFDADDLQLSPLFAQLLKCIALLNSSDLRYNADWITVGDRSHVNAYDGDATPADGE
jgi:hypothetical protein